MDELLNGRRRISAATHNQEVAQVSMNIKQHAEYKEDDYDEDFKLDNNNTFYHPNMLKAGDDLEEDDDNENADEINKLLGSSKTSSKSKHTTDTPVKKTRSKSWNHDAKTPASSKERRRRVDQIHQFTNSQSNENWMNSFHSEIGENEEHETRAPGNCAYPDTRQSKGKGTSPDRRLKSNEKQAFRIQTQRSEMRYTERLRRLEQENEMLRENARRWKNKHEQEIAVNKELGKRVKKWRSECTKLERQVKDLEERLQAQEALAHISPVSTLNSPKPWWAGSNGGGRLSPKLDLPPAVPELCSEGFGMTPLSVDLSECSPRMGDVQSSRTKLFSHVIIIDSNDDLSYCWPSNAKDQVPSNVEQFCFRQGSPDNLACFVFMLSGESATPLTRGFSCLDNATYGICLSDGLICMCLLTKHPFFHLGEQILRLLDEVARGSDEGRDAVLQGVMDSVAEIDCSLAGPGFRIDSGAGLFWEWPMHWTRRSDLFLDWGLSTLLESLPLDQILFLAGCLLLELKVVVVGANLRRLTAAAFALLPLIRPAVWVQPFIPLLPPNLSMVCDAPVPVFVGAREVPAEVQDVDDAEHASESTTNSLAYHDNGRQEAVVVHLEEGRLELSQALSTSYHALKLPGLSELVYHIGEGADVQPLLTAVHKHLTGLLEACRFFGRSAGNLAVASSIPPDSNTDVCDEAERDLANFVPLLQGRNLSISPPWQYLAKLQTTQLFMQWCETHE